MFKALQVNRGDDKSVTTGIVELNDSDLPEGDVTVKVEYSALNYKVRISNPRCVTFPQPIV